MSGPWRITRGDQQLSAKDVAELKLMAAGGKILPSDLVQPPGKGEWFYATEVPELQGLVAAKESDPEDFDIRRKTGSGNLGRGLAVVAAAGLFLGGIYAVYTLYTTRPEEPLGIVGDHEGGLNPLEALVTQYANLLAEPDSSAAKVGEVKKDERVQLVRKMGDFYEVVTPDKRQGWVGTGQIVPGYLFDQELTDKYDPLFNPNVYLQLMNYSWTPSLEPGKPDTLTNMMFNLANPTDYGMQGVILKVTFFDGKDRVIDVKNFEVPRLVPPNDVFFLEGIEVDMEWNEETRAEVEIFGARALLPPEYEKLKKEEDVALEITGKAGGEAAE